MRQSLSGYFQADAYSDTTHRSFGMAVLVVCQLDELRIALNLSSVERVLRAVYPTVLPAAPDIVLGVINVQGRVTPLITPRRRFRVPDRALALNDQFIVAHTGSRPVVLAVDKVFGVAEYPERDIMAADDVLPDMKYVAGIVKLADGLILIHNLDTFLSLEEETALDQALSSTGDA